jgi:hypothetical protein
MELGHLEHAICGTSLVLSGGGREKRLLEQGLASRLTPILHTGGKAAVACCSNMDHSDGDYEEITALLGPDHCKPHNFM